MGLKKILVYKELLDGNLGKIHIDNSQNKNYNHCPHMCNPTDNQKGAHESNVGSESRSRCKIHNINGKHMETSWRIICQCILKALQIFPYSLNSH